MRFDVITLFPELFAPFRASGVTRRAFVATETVVNQSATATTSATEASPAEPIALQFWNPRDHAPGNYRRVDDRPFGGGPGMVMLAQPLADTLAAIRSARSDPAPVLLFSPLGRRLDHAAVARWAASDGAILVCGRYEGIDQRFIDTHVDEQISLGDFVLSGGEIAAIALLDAVARLQPGVLNDAGSHQADSFNPALDGLLDCPHYTRPEQWQGQGVPAALLSGHHAQIERWRRDRRLELSARLRPELIQQARQQGLLSAVDEAFLAGLDSSSGSTPSV